MRKILKSVFHLPIWWYKDSLAWWKRFFTNLLIFLDNRLAVSLMVQMFFVPLFHDTSFLGRTLSLIYRLIRIIIGSLVIALASVAMLIWFSAWLGLPLLLLASLKPGGSLGLACLWLIDSYCQLRQSTITKAAQALIKGQQPLSHDSQVKEILNRLEIAYQSLDNLTPPVNRNNWLKAAKEEAAGLGESQTAPEHLLLAWLKQENWRYQPALATVKWLKQQKRWLKTPFIWDKDYEIRPIGGVNRALTGVPTPTLDRYSQDLTKLAQKRQLPETFAKDAIIDQISQILSREQQNNVLVVGPPGSGKTTLIKSLAQEIVRGVKAKSLRFKRLVALDTSQLAAGANSAELNQRITKIIAEIRAAENIILFADEVHNLASLNQDSPETSDIFIALEPVLSEGAFQFIGATSTENYKKYLEPNEAMARLMSLVELPEADKEQTLSILEYLAWKRELEDKVKITTIGLQTIIDLSQQLIHDRVFPDKAVALLDEVLAMAKSHDHNLVTSLDVEKLISQKTKVPVTKLSLEEKKRLLNLEKKLHQRVIGQDKAIKAIANAIRRSRTGLKDSQKPIASFLFAGPTGVGKTETAKTLAQEFFGSEKLMIRLDMSEYQNLDSLNRLIGAPPGTEQSYEGGQLTEAARHQPYTLILLDEIEKAHPKVLNLFLQVLDDARLTDSLGRVIDFSNTIIIATTNARGSLDDAFAPEFLNRFTAIIVFSALTEKEAEAIVKLKLKQLTQNLLKQEIIIEFSPETIKQLTQEGFSTKWGGRQIERVIQSKISDSIASKILKGEIKKREPVTFSL